MTITDLNKWKICILENAGRDTVKSAGRYSGALVNPEKKQLLIFPFTRLLSELDFYSFTQFCNCMRIQLLYDTECAKVFNNISDLEKTIVKNAVNNSCATWDEFIKIKLTTPQIESFKRHFMRSTYRPAQIVTIGDILRFSRPLISPAFLPKQDPKAKGLEYRMFLDKM